MKPLTKRNNRRINYFLLLLSFFAVVIFGAIVFFHQKRDVVVSPLAKNTVKVDPKKLVSHFTAPATPPPTASPSASPTPTPEAYSGFCLHVPVLFYHHIQPQSQATAKGQTNVSVDSTIFDGQMGYLASHGYTAIFADQLINALGSHTGLPPKSIVITFDDGYKDNHDFALPVLRKYNLKANLMISSGLIDSGTDFLSWGDINDMKASGLFYFTDHTWSHYAINHGSVDKIQYEIQTAQKQIQDHTGQPVNIFTYPYGSTSPLAIQLLTQDGFIGAFTTIPGTTQCDSFIMALHRTRIGNASLAAYGF